MEKDDKLEINHPKRYNADTPYECYKVLQAWMTKEQFQGYLRGNCLKYLCRVGKKDDEVQELGKCKWYLEKLIESFQDVAQDAIEERLNNLMMAVRSNPDFNSVDCTWNKKQPKGVSKAEHYHTFLDMLKNMLSTFTLKYNLVPNTLIINLKLIAVPDFLDSFERAKDYEIFDAGYIIGKLLVGDEWLDVIIAPDLGNKFFMLNNSRPEFITGGKVEEE